MGPQCASDRRLRFIKGTFYPSPMREGRARRASVGGAESPVAHPRETAGSSVRSTCAMKCPPNECRTHDIALQPRGGRQRRQ